MPNATPPDVQGHNLVGAGVDRYFALGLGVAFDSKQLGKSERVGPNATPLQDFRGG